MMSSSKSSDSILWQGAILPASITSIVSIIFFTLLQSRSGTYGALLASVTVIIFFSVHLLVARISRNLDPMVTMALAMFSYFVKVIFMGVFLFLVTKMTDPSTINRGSFAITAILITMAWLFGEIRSFFKLRSHLELPKKVGKKVGKEVGE
jgi:ATP synthase protein I